MGTWADSFLPAITGELAQVGPAMQQGQLQGMNAARQLAFLDMQIKQQQMQNMQAERQMNQPQLPTFHNLGAGAFAITDPRTGLPTQIQRPPQPVKEPHQFQPIAAQPGQPIFNPNTNQWITAPGQAPAKPPIPFEPGQPIFQPTTGQWGTAPGQAKVKPSQGQNALDAAFAKDYADFVAGGGYADVTKQLGQLRNASAALATDNSLTGPYVGMIPDRLRNITNPQAMAVRDSVLEVVQRNLRMILGPQFTEREGILLMKRAYNEQQTPEENKKRVDRLIKQIETAAKAKADAGQYFEQHGTLQGWKGKLPSLSDFNPESGDVSAPSLPKLAPKGQGVPFSPMRPKVRIKGDADYAGLPPGTMFIGPDGVTRKKP